MIPGSLGECHCVLLSPLSNVSAMFVIVEGINIQRNKEFKFFVSTEDSMKDNKALIRIKEELNIGSEI